MVFLWEQTKITAGEYHFYTKTFKYDVLCKYRTLFLQSSSSKVCHKAWGWPVPDAIPPQLSYRLTKEAGTTWLASSILLKNVCQWALHCSSLKKKSLFCLASSNGKPQSGKGRKWHWGAWEMEHIQSSQTRLEPMTFTVYTIGGWEGPVYLCCNSSQPWGSTPDKMTRLLCSSRTVISHNSLNQHSLPQDKAAGVKLTQGCSAKPNTEKRGLWGLRDSPQPLGL